VSAYDEGYRMGQYRKTSDSYDPRWDFADHAKAGTFAEFKRGFEDGFDGKEFTP
jgi:hypothetical protein